MQLMALSPRRPALYVLPYHQGLLHIIADQCSVVDPSMRQPDHRRRWREENEAQSLECIFQGPSLTQFSLVRI